jgi:hypothetical protein
MITLVLIAAISAQAVRNARADDECLAKPNAPAPQGQHWYYRIDHANNKRQCWRLGLEGLPVQKSAPQADNSATPEAAAQPASPPRATETNTAATAAPVLWLDVPKLPDLPAARAPLPPTASADDAAPVVVSDDTPASASEPLPTRTVHSERPQRPVAAQIAPSAAHPQKPVEADHTFALLMVMFALLAVTGPILHFTHRMREREVVNFKPPRWAPVVALNTPAPRARMLHPRDLEFGRQRAPKPIRPPVQPERPPAPVPVRPPEPSERLAQALQQLVDRIQTTRRREPDTMSRPAHRASMEMMKSAR